MTNKERALQLAKEYNNSGYRRIDDITRTISRIDRPDWTREFNIPANVLNSVLSSADHYRKYYSLDKIDGVPLETYQHILHSTHDTVGFEPITKAIYRRHLTKSTDNLLGLAIQECVKEEVTTQLNKLTERVYFEALRTGDKFKVSTMSQIYQKCRAPIDLQLTSSTGYALNINIALNLSTSALLIFNSSTQVYPV